MRILPQRRDPIRREFGVATLKAGGIKKSKVVALRIGARQQTELRRIPAHFLLKRKLSRCNRRNVNSK
jgi:hypothetical protein